MEGDKIAPLNLGFTNTKRKKRMAAVLEESKGIKRVLQVSVPQAEIDLEMDKQALEVSRRARLPGFRPGKLPLAVVKKQFGPSIRSEVVSKSIEKGYVDALKEHALKPAGMPKITVDPASVAGDLSFKVELEVYPEFEVKGLADLEIKRTNAVIVDADMVKMLDNLRKQHVEWETVTRAAADGDRLTIDFEGFKDKEAFAGGSAKDFRITLGSKMMIPGFEDGLIGKAVDDAFDLKLSFPKDYHVKDLAGAPVVFKITVKSIEAPKLPELNDAFAKLFKEDSLEALQKEVRLNMDRELEFSLKESVKKQVLEGLLKHNEIELPSALVKEEAERLAAAAQEKMKSWGQAAGKQSLPLEMFEAEAKKRVALGLIMHRIILQFDLKVDPARVKDAVTKMASVYENPEEITKMLMQNRQRMSEIEQVVLEEQVVDKVIEGAKVTEETKSFDEVIQSANASANILPQG